MSVQWIKRKKEKSSVQHQEWNKNLDFVEK